jgi:selenocysteine-specific elongation factor
VSALGEPLTLGTAGHVDHGKTALVKALTGVDTDRLPQEKTRGLTIELGYAPLRLAGGRRLSLIDVPGHERFVRTMVSGASGIDLFLMVIAADDGVMPQTLEHAEVLRALGIHGGVVAVTKSDLADPGPALAQGLELFPKAPVIACSSRTGEGLGELADALEALATQAVSRAGSPGPARLHVDRVFTVSGRGTVATGTLWSGAIAVGDALELLPRGVAVRVRGIQVHDVPQPRALAGQRVAVNLIGARRSEIARGDLLAAPHSVHEASVLDCALELRAGRSGERVQVHHGTRSVPARLARLEENLCQLRLERPLMALEGDRLVVRRVQPPETLGGGVVLDTLARRHGARPEVLERLRRLRDGEAAAAGHPAVDSPPSSTTEVPACLHDEASVDPGALAALERRLLDAGTAPLSEAQLSGDLAALRSLRAEGRAVRLSGRLYAHADVVVPIRDELIALIEGRGSLSLAEARDALGLSRKSTQAFLEYLDRSRVTRRLPSDRRVLAADSRSEGALR